MTKFFAFFAGFSLAVQAAPLVEDAKVPGRLLLTADAISGAISLATPAPHITTAYFANDPARRPLNLTFNADATEVGLKIPEALRQEKGPIALEVSRNSQSFPDGRVVFSALDAKVIGKDAKLESNPGNHCIGYWGNIKDKVVWDFKPTTWGMYHVELTYSLASERSDILVRLAGIPVKATIPATGSWHEYTTVNLGKVYLAQDKPTRFLVRGIKKYGGGVMNLKSVTLRPAPEGAVDVISPSRDGMFCLMASQATVYGTKLRYEPQPKKLCIGYWTNPQDFAIWDFKVAEKTKYKVAIYQGCGGGNGGSKVDVVIGSTVKSFVVKETGHFQKFIPIDLGEIELELGQHKLEIRPKNKTKTAVMDVQKVLLTPVK